MIRTAPPAVNPPIAAPSRDRPLSISLVPPDHQQPATLAAELSGYAAGLLEADDLAAERLSADALAFEMAARAAEADDELADLESRALGTCRPGMVSGLLLIPSARGSVRSMAFA